MKSYRFAMAALVCLFAAGCSETIAPSAQPSAVNMQLAVVAGDAQSALPNTELPDAIVVQATDARGRRLGNQIVNFRVVSGGGSVFAGAAITDPLGFARERWTLGASGEQKLEVRAVDTETGAALTFATFTATLLTPAALSANRSSVDFGALLTGTTSSIETITISNTGTAPAGAVTAAITGADAARFAIASNTCTTLAGNGTCTIAVKYSPTAIGSNSATLTVNATQGSAATVALGGSSVAPAQLSAPGSVDFGTIVPGSSNTATVTVTNPGGIAAGTTTSLSTSITGTSASQFSITATTCAATLAGGSSCTYTVRFSPNVSGTATASLVISSAPGGTATVSLTGVAQIPAQLVATATADFGSVVTGDHRDVNVTVTNSGGAAAGTSGVLDAALSGNDAAAFSIVSTTCGSTLAGGASCNYVVRFAPISSTGSQPYAATLTFSSTPGGAAAVALSGTALRPASLVFTEITSFPTTLVGQTAPDHALAIFTNGGEVPATNLVFAFTGNQAASFSVVGSSCGTTIAPLASCTVTMAFTPTVTKENAATLTVTSTESSVSHPISASGTYLAFTVPTQDFGSVTTTGLNVRTLTLKNFSPQTVSDITLNGLAPIVFSNVYFTLQSTTCGAPVAPGGTCTATVSYHNTTTSDARSILTARSLQVGSATVSLTGTRQ